MRIGQIMKVESLHTPGRWDQVEVLCFEHDKEDGWAIVRPLNHRPGYSWPVRRKRLVPFDPKAKFTAKGGGDDPAGAPALMAEVS